jgi:cholestenol Delta-isomerase
MASGDIAHPYFPQDLILPGYVPNELDAVSLLAIFATGCSVILSIAFLINDDLKLSDRMTVLWFILCKYTLPYLRQDFKFP